MRDLFTTGPGPDAGGSNPGKEGCDHMPEKSGMDAAPLADPAAGVAVCAQAGIAAAANASNKGKSHRRTLMISSVHDCPRSSERGQFRSKDCSNYNRIAI